MFLAMFEAFVKANEIRKGSELRDKEVKLRPEETVMKLVKGFR